VSPFETIARFVRWVLRDETYYRHFLATVERDNGDNTVDLVCDDPAVRGIGMQAVPVKTGIAGATSRAEQGARCLLGFAAGDPRQPQVVAWEFGRETATVFLDGGTAGVARFADPVEVEYSDVMAVSGMAGGTQTIPNPSPPPATIDVTIPAGPFTGIAIVLTPPIAVVQGGNPTVTA
jgi:hypothetical protein